MYEPLRRLGLGLLDLALPPRCAGCGRDFAAPLCAACREELPPDLEAGPPPLRLDACVAAVAYAGATPGWMQRFKYPQAAFSRMDPGAREVVCSLAVDAGWLAPGPPPGAVVPVPLHPRRLRARGFNPAALLARRIARAQRVPFRPLALRRVRDTPTQTGLDRKQRRRNVRSAFEARRAAPQCVWLVDDVVTTGATLSECARVLRRAGARRVVGVCAARTPRPID